MQRASAAQTRVSSERLNTTENGGAYSTVSDAVSLKESKTFLSVRHFHSQVGLRQTSHLMLVSRDSTVEGSAAVNMSGSQDEYCEGRWFDARQVLSSVKESGPFRLMLRFASAKQLG